MTETGQGAVTSARWRDVPRLSWVLACAWGSGPAWVRRLTAPVLAVALGVPTVVGGRLRGQVLHLAGRAVVVVDEPRGFLRGVLSLGAAFLAALPGVAVLGVVLSAVTVGLPGRLGDLVVAAYLVGSAAPMLCSTVVRSLREGAGAGGARRAGLVPADAARVGMLAAWPQRKGHARRLLGGLGPALTDYPHPIVATARTEELAAWYEEVAGLHPIAPGSLVLLRLPRLGGPEQL